MQVSPSSPPLITIIGAGALGTALAHRLAGRGYPIVAVLSRRAASARRLAAAVGAEIAGTDLALLPPTTQLVFCCVPDDALTPLAEALYDGAHPWSETTVAHTSGAYASDVLDPLALRGAAVMSFHPLQTFPPGTDPAAFEGIYVGLEGTPAAVTLGRRVAADLGAHAVVIRPEAKALYHLAASLASNSFVALMGLVQEVLAATGVPADVRAAMMQPLVARTWANLQQGAPEDVLTGPVARGDAETVGRHAEALQAHLPHLVPVYVALANEAVRLAVRGRHLDPEAAQRLLDRLHDALPPPDTSLF